MRHWLLFIVIALFRNPQRFGWEHGEPWSGGRDHWISKINPKTGDDVAEDVPQGADRALSGLAEGQKGCSHTPCLTPGVKHTGQGSRNLQKNSWKSHCSVSLPSQDVAQEPCMSFRGCTASMVSEPQGTCITSGGGRVQLAEPQGHLARPILPSMTRGRQL